MHRKLRRAGFTRHVEEKKEKGSRKGREDMEKITERANVNQQNLTHEWTCNLTPCFA